MAIKTSTENCVAKNIKTTKHDEKLFCKYSRNCRKKDFAQINFWYRAVYSLGNPFLLDPALDNFKFL